MILGQEVADLLEWGKVAANSDAFAMKVTELGAGEILLTSMDRDGTKAGFDCEMTAAVSK